MTELHMTGATPDEVWPLVRDFHYSRKMPSAIRHCFAWREPGGLFGDSGEPIAAAIFGNPVNRNWPQDALELQRLVRVNDCSIKLSTFLAWCMRWIRANTNTPFCLSYADTAENHHGGIYQASGWRFVGARTESCPAFLLPDGTKKHSRQVNRELGSRSISFVAAKKPDWVPVSGKPKNLYVFPLRKRLKPLFEKFGWQDLPYPKLAARPEDEQGTILCESGATPEGRSNTMPAIPAAITPFPLAGAARAIGGDDG